jgi:hypothetical protein
VSFELEVSFEMKKEDFSIGLEFYAVTGKWRCIDIGTRAIAAIKINREDIII